MKPENVKCPICDGPMKSRQNRLTGQFFWGCLKFPECKGTRDTDGLSKEEKYKDQDLLK